MISFLRKIINNKDYKRISENIVSLFSLQGLTYLLPLITFPYLTRVLGPEKYGLVIFALAFIGYFQILTDYGFNLTATRQISLNRDNKKELTKIFSSVLATKFILMITSLIFMLIIIFSFEMFRTNYILYIFTFGLVIGNFLFPYWFFQGIEKMKYISILNIITLIIYTLAIFVFIKNDSDYIYVTLINSISSITIGIIAILMLIKKFKIKFIIPTLEDIKFQLNEGWHVFISTIGITLYTVSNTFILGFFTNYTIVGYYSVAEKIIRTVLGLLTPFSQSIYPYMSALVTKSKEDAIIFIGKVTRIIAVGSLIVSFLLFLFADLIVYILAGPQYVRSALLVKIMCLLPFIVALNTMFGTQTMLTLNYKKSFSSIIIIGGFINLILAFILAPLYQDIGISISFVITETFITVSMFLYLKNKNINLLRRKNV